jgi:hypothetical protein
LGEAIEIIGAPEGIRTPDPQIRSLELRNSHFSEQLADALFLIESEHVKFLS